MYLWKSSFILFYEAEIVYMKNWLLIRAINHIVVICNHLLVNKYLR